MLVVGGVKGGVGVAKITITEALPNFIFTLKVVDKTVADMEHTFLLNSYSIRKCFKVPPKNSIDVKKQR